MPFSRTPKSLQPSVPIHTLQGSQIEIVESYKYLGIWLDTIFTFKTHVEQLTRKLKVKIGFLHSHKSCLCFAIQKTIVQSTIPSAFDYGDTVYMQPFPPP